MGARTCCRPELIYRRRRARLRQIVAVSLDASKTHLLWLVFEHWRVPRSRLFRISTAVFSKTKMTYVAVSSIRGVRQTV